MAIDAKMAKRLCGKFSGMSMMPTDKGALDLRSDALARRARSEGHAQRVVQAIIEREAYFPTVSVIVQECENSPDDVQAIQQRNECEWCHGDGFRSVEGPYGTSAAYPCDHRGTVPGNPGAPMPRAVEAHYRQEHARFCR